jgi:protein-S-isoprenylcysteine O-methyltransferase Ste14
LRFFFFFFFFFPFARFFFFLSLISLNPFSSSSIQTQYPSFFIFPTIPFLYQIFQPTAAYIVLAWLAFQAALYMLLPGPVVKGVLLRDGRTRLRYRLNGLRALAVSLACYLAGWWFGLFRAAQIADRYLALAGAATVISFALSSLLYFSAVRGNAVPALGGNTGEIWYDFFVGRELNPRIGEFDFKFFCELRPGLTGWMILNLSLALAQYEGTGSVANSLVLVNLFQGWYVIDSVLYEAAVLTTMDIVHDGFGWMLVFGDLTWVPFTYSLQARFLYERPVDLSWPAVAAIVALNIAGYAAFRLSNLEKNRFRRDPNAAAVSHLSYIETKSGSKLLVSGWWGTARHINYTADWTMSVAWCLTCGFTHILPYFYCIYFAVLLIHRELRDEHNCRKKYGKDWDRYCELVPYRFFPGII